MESLTRVAEFLIKVLTAAALILLLSIIWLQMTKHPLIDIEIDPILVPNALADRGYTSGVATARLRDAINRIIIDAASSMEPPHFPPTDRVDVVIREVRLDPEAIGRWLGYSLGFRHRHDISGDITIGKSESIGEQQLYLRVRFNNEPFPGSESSLPWQQLDSRGPSGNFDTLFDAAAAGILELTHPYLVGVVCFTNDRDDRRIAREMMDRIIATHSEQSEETARAHNVRGWLAFADNRFDYAKAEFVLATKADERGLSPARKYLAYAAYEPIKRQIRDRPDQLPVEKLKEVGKLYRKALDFDRYDVGKLNDYGDFLNEMEFYNALRSAGLRDRADAQYLEVIRLSRDRIRINPADADAYGNLGHAWRMLSEIHKAAADKAKNKAQEILLDKTREELREARAVLHLAIELRPLNPDAHYDLLLADGDRLSLADHPTSMFRLSDDEYKLILGEAWGEFVHFKALNVIPSYYQERQFVDAVKHVAFGEPRFGDQDNQEVRSSKLQLAPCPVRHRLIP